jgi:hypothetical protein
MLKTKKLKNLRKQVLYEVNIENIFEKRELAEVIKHYNKGNLDLFLHLLDKHCPTAYGLDCAGYDGNINCKGNCTLCWMFALKQFAFENFGVNLSETKPMSRAVI